MAEVTPIDDREEVLRRQVPPGLWDDANGQPMWTAFGPNSGDEGKMSTLRGHVDPKEAHRRHTEDWGLRSNGTWPVRVGDAVTLNLKCYDDGGVGDLPEDHASVDFRELTRSDKKIAMRKLHELACSDDAGPLFQP